jgi:hypothetical protein
MAYYTAIQSTLATDPILTGLLAPTAGQPANTSVWYDTAPPHTNMPFLTFFSVGGPPPGYTFEKDYTEPHQLQFDIDSEDSDVSIAIGAQVDKLLNWQSLTIDNARLMKFERVSPLDDVHMEEEVDEADIDVWRLTLLYEMTLIRSL